MKELDMFLQEIVTQGFKFALRWTPCKGSIAVTYTVFAPSGKGFGRGVLLDDKVGDYLLTDIHILIDSAKKTVEYIRREKPEELVGTKPAPNVEEIFAR